jgi:D-aspartate ligase
VNEFAQTARFPLVVKAAAWLDPKLKVSIVRTERELIDVWHWVERFLESELANPGIHPPGEDWFFHGYCNGASDCLAGFTGVKLRFFPPHTLV